MVDLVRLVVSQRPVMLTFAEPDILVNDLVKVLRLVHPTEMLAVPRVYEKFETALRDSVRSSSSTG